ncbi:ABC transporter ATP-binding protein [Helicobacter heilmannii]|uniref:ABC transporter ATP-binding protein n=1 Tax=Helicobacter heilmannii TaxID=35817 RepID=UPI0006A22921|nr:dipeptide/oligopeptide/nickel ABC transporter ATP-binding protein [Helicobacter heilmannii]CRF48196.1 Oligopeptide transport ATP-binding protein OppF (TC 3.A.1.5.1) [Helicobacter heilmannii]CRF50789.1 Oligopeptide transport ATP-binding protein OppF (TC 3.A.1.5.1) [Helicobacter heilmannii]
MLLEVLELFKFYGAQKVLEGVSFSLERGELVALMGSSGCGKSTLAKCIARLEPFSGGQVLYEQQDILQMEEKPFRQVLQYVFQDQLNALNPAKKVRDLLGSVCRRFKTHALLNEALELAKLSPKLLGRYPRELSGGERQRLGIARAMLVCPEILLLDETTSALDKKLKHEIMQVVSAYQKEKQTTILFITHDAALAMGYCARVLRLKEGRLFQG